MTPSPRIPDSHESGRDMVAFAAGLLSDEAEARLTAHLKGCASCRESFESLTEQDDWHAPAEQHLPAAVLARWPKMHSELRGLERELVQKHLRRCDSCRAELITLGFDPELLSRSVPTSVATPSLEVDKPARRVRTRRPGGGWRDIDWTRWALGGWSTIATAAAAWLLWASPSALRQHPAQSLPQQQLETLSRHDLDRIVDWNEDTRGEAAPGPPPLISVVPGQRYLPLKSPPLPTVPEAQPVLLEVRSNTDSLLWSVRTTLGELGRAEYFIVRPEKWTWPQGTYNLLVKIEPIQGVDGSSSTFQFEVELSKPLQ